jgi:hypothetical protein
MYAPQLIPYADRFVGTLRTTLDEVPALTGGRPA